MLGGLHQGPPQNRSFQDETFPLFNDLQTLFAGKVATGQFAISSTGATKRKIDDEISVDNSSDESLVTAIVNKDAPLTAAKQRTRQPLLKKSPTVKFLICCHQLWVENQSPNLLRHYGSSVNYTLRNILSGNMYNLKNIFQTHPVMQRHF